MTTFDYFLVFYFAANALMTVAIVGKQREPLEPPAGALVVAMYGGMIAWLLASHGVFS